MKKRLRLIIAGFCISFVMMVALSYISVKRFTQLNSYFNSVERTFMIISRLDDLESTIKDIDRFEKGYLLTHDTTYLGLLKTPVARVIAKADSIRKISDDKDAQEDISFINSFLAVRLNELRTDLEYADTNRSSVLSPSYYEGRQKSWDALRHIQKMREREQKALHVRNSFRYTYERLTYKNITLLFFIFGIVTLVLFVIIISELRKRMIFQDELENKLMDLKRSHAELEQIAFASSHDLREPLRKIQVFSDRILLKQKNLDDDSLNSLQRIQSSANRMQELMEHLSGLTNLILEQEYKEYVDLNKTMEAVQDELQNEISSRQASFQSAVLPVINGYPGQLHVLFKALLENSLKFSRNGVPPAIVVTYTRTAGEELEEIKPNTTGREYHLITITDNGIGFDNRYTHKMFFLFQKLHNEEDGYAGKGIGLTMCQRIMVNHKGFISAAGETGKGAKFSLYFPVE
jgi:signal transduction histidine kinase